MTVLVDTNVLVAAFLTRGACHELIEHLVRQHRPVVSEDILAELRRVLAERFGVPAEDVAEAESLLRSRFVVVSPEEPFPAVCADPGDDHVLAAAADLDVLVTGDAELLRIGAVGGARIVSPSGFWKFELGREA